jgi:hypothetical protein
VAFVKLLPRGEPLPVAEVVRRLREEFPAFEADPDEGRDRVADMIVATLRLSDSDPRKRARLAELEAVQAAAVQVRFGDDWHCAASCCVLPGAELVFGRRAEVAGPAREAVERAAEVLGYDLQQG